MSLNRKFGKLVNGAVTYAPNALVTDASVTLNPTEEQYLSAGYKPVVDTPPETDSQHYAVPSGWEENDSAIVRVYEIRETDTPIYTLSKLKCHTALKEMGAWDAVYKWLNDNDLWIAFLLANEVRTDHPQFVQGFATIKSMLGLTDDQGDAFIKKCVME